MSRHKLMRAARHVVSIEIMKEKKKKSKENARFLLDRKFLEGYIARMILTFRPVDFMNGCAIVAKLDRDDRISV